MREICNANGPPPSPPQNEKIGNGICELKNIKMSLSCYLDSCISFNVIYIIQNIL